MGVLLLNDELPTNSSVSSKSSSSLLSKMATRTKAAAPRKNSIACQPTQMDVLCGQDKTFSQHPGNNLYRSVIAAWAPKYGQSTNKQSKMRMTTHICKVMKMHYNSRFLKPTPILMEHCRAESEGSDVAAFRWTELTDQAARDKISHALRTSATAARRRLELRKKQKSILHQHQNEEKQQSAESQPWLQVDELWFTTPQFPYHNIRSFIPISEVPSDIWLADTEKSDLQNFEPLPVSSPDFYCSDYVAASTSQLFDDDSDDERSVAQSLLERQQEIFRQLKELQTSSQTKPRSKKSKGKSSSLIKIHSA